jgi:condensin-2 complex subunit D3
VPSAIRAQAIIALGKIMLHKEKLAKKYVAVLARELETCTDPVIRNNVVVVMCDLCVRCGAVLCLVQVARMGQMPYIRNAASLLLSRQSSQTCARNKTGAEC